MSCLPGQSGSRGYKIQSSSRHYSHTVCRGKRCRRAWQGEAARIEIVHAAMNQVATLNEIRVVHRKIALKPVPSGSLPRQPLA